MLLVDSVKDRVIGAFFSMLARKVCYAATHVVSQHRCLRQQHLHGP